MQSKSRITVVSEGRIFHGVRTPLAFSWVEATEASPARMRQPPRAPASNLVYVFGQLAKLKLTKQDLAQRRQQAAGLPARELELLAAALRAAARAPAR